MPSVCGGESVGCVIGDDGLGDVIGAAVSCVTVRPAIDSGATDNVIHPTGLQGDVVIVPNTSGRHVRGANDSVIERHGACDTLLESTLDEIGCGW